VKQSPPTVYPLAAPDRSALVCAAGHDEALSGPGPAVVVFHVKHEGWVLSKGDDGWIRKVWGTRTGQ
jgi:hypothetical protein